MSIFDQSIPVDLTPDLTDTVEETAELENTEEYDQYDEQEAEVTDEQEATDPEQGHSEELIAGKFKTTEDLVKSYKALERKLHERNQTPAQQSPVTQQQAGDPDATRDAIIEAINKDPMGTLNWFAQQAVQQAMAPLQQERTQDRTIANLEKVAESYKQVKSEEGLGQLFDKIEELAQDFGNPNLVKNPTPRIMQMAAKELWGEQSMTQVYNQAVQAGRQQAEESRRAKAGLNAPGNTKPKQAPKTDSQTIAEGILAASKRSGLFG